VSNNAYPTATAASLEGQRVPQVTLRTRQGSEWVDRTSDDLFAGKRVVLFALPGAFTPTCSSSHLPRYEELYEAFAAAGIDAVYCLSVNDAFVMNAWGEDQGAERVTLLPDGNGDFSRGLGMLVDKQGLGFGERSWRYAAVIDDGVVEKLFSEPHVEGDPYEVSDADTVLAYVAPGAEAPLQFSLFTRAGCPHCARAKALLEREGARYEEIQLSKSVTARSLQAVTGATTVPQVYLGGEHLGGADALEAWFARRREPAPAA
jgi:glutaredoxin-like protein